MFIWEVNIIFIQPNALFHYRGNNKQLLYICYYEHLLFIQKYFFIRAAWRMCILHVEASVHCSQHKHVSCVCWFTIGLSHVERKWHSKKIILYPESRLMTSFYSEHHCMGWFWLGTWGWGYLELSSPSDPNKMHA